MNFNSILQSFHLNRIQCSAVATLFKQVLGKQGKLLCQGKTLAGEARSTDLDLNGQPAVCVRRKRNTLNHGRVVACLRVRDDYVIVRTVCLVGVMLDLWNIREYDAAVTNLAHFNVLQYLLK